jgi:PAS domain S-box-containing protein
MNIQRYAVTAAAFLVGITILEALRLTLLGQSLPWLSWGAILLAALAAAGVSLLLEKRLSSSSNTSKTAEPPKQERLQAELAQLNQELAARSQEQANELARLNVELQLQMAKHQQAEENAHFNEVRFRAMADNIQEGLVIIEDNRLVYVNQRACEIYGDCLEGELTQWVLKLAAPEEQPRLRRLLDEAAARGEFPCELEYWILRADGSRRCVRERYSHSADHGLERTFIVASDITEAVQAYHDLETAVSDRTRELSTMLEVSHKIASTLELEPLLYLILDQIQKVIPNSGSAIFTLDEGVLTVAAYQVPGFPPQERPIFLSVGRAERFQPLIQEKQVQIVDDIQGDTPLARAVQESLPGRAGFTFAHARSWIGIPLVYHERLTGLLSLVHSDPGFYTQRHAHLGLTIANQIAVTVENVRFYEQAQNLAVLEERSRIARELHDSVTQLLYGITLYCTATSRSLRSANHSQVEQNLVEIKENAMQALQEMRLLILELNPPLLQKAGLAAALQASLEVIETRTGLQTELKLDGVSRLPRAIESDLYRIAMEALNNLVRYAHAKKVTVGLRAGDGWVWLEICDNGVGFDLAQAWKSGGMGLHSMEQRARGLGGRLEVTSSPGAGTRILVEAPVFAPRGEKQTANQQ